MTADPSDIRARLRKHRALDPSAPPQRRSAVAALLRHVGPGLEVLLMTRAQRVGDPWSGHIALPGGRAEPADTDLLRTAIRETQEEVGVDLEREAEMLCRLEPIQARARGRKIAMDVTPFVFWAGGPVEASTSDEAAEVFWFPLSEAAGGGFDAEYPYEKDGLVHRLPSWSFEGRSVWGLTYRMLSELIRVLQEP